MASMSELFHNRDAASGVITRMAEECEALKNAPVDSIVVSMIERKLASVEKASEEFMVNHDSLSLEDEELVKDDHHKDTLSAHLDLIQCAMELLIGLRNRARAALLIREVEPMLDDIEESVSERGYTSDLDQEMSAVAEGLQLIRKARGQPGARVCNEVSDLSKSVTTRYRTLKGLQTTTTEKKPAAIATVMDRRQGLVLDLLQFDGTVLSYRNWKGTFLAVMSEEPHLTDHSKKCHFLKCMATAECKALAEDVFSFTDGFDEALKEFSKKFESKRVLHAYHHTEFFQADTVDAKKKDYDRAVLRIRKSLRGFKEAGADTQGQTMTMHAQKCMTPKVLALWKLHTSSSTVTPPIEELIKFFEKQANSVGDEDIPWKNATPTPTSKPRQPHKPSGRTVLQVQHTPDKCSLCKGSHLLFACLQYKEKTPAQRQEHVKASRACYNCLSANHRVNDCPSEHRCKTCQGKHHSSIHLPRRAPQSTTREEEDGTVNLLDRDHSAKREIGLVLPSTALMKVRANNGCQQARAQLDTGATLSLITSKLAAALQAPELPDSAINITSFGGVSTSSHRVRVTLLGKEGEELSLEPQVVESIPSSHTRADVKNIHRLPFLKGLQLADPSYSSAARIDLLLDVGTSNACCRPGVKFSSSPGLKAESTIFGWTVSGTDSPTTRGYQKKATLLHVSPAEDPVQIFRDLMELEQEPSEGSHLTKDEQSAVQQFEENVTRDDDGRYRVGLPRKTPTPVLGKSRENAVRRYVSNERALKKRGEWEPFSKAVENYSELDHAELVPEGDLQKSADACFYLPMHGVVKLSSTTTKLRVVYDASAKSSSGTSLNDTLLPGPSYYPLLTTILTKFRVHRIAISADISMMFREIGLREEDKDYHRYVHRNDVGELEDRRMTRLTFGVTSSPFLATQVLRRLASDHEEDFPLASRLIMNDFYVDDCMTGAETVEEAVEVVDELSQLTRKACMTLKKFRSDSPALLSTIPEDRRETSDLHLASHPSNCSKALGLHWSTATDCLHVATPEINPEEKATKRRVASAVARIFDVLGWFSPATLPARIILQRSWAHKLGWDDALPPDLQTGWSKWVDDLAAITQHPIPRYLGIKKGEARSRQIHGFADTSILAYGGVVDVRMFYCDLTVSVDLVVSQARVTPLKTTTIPRLELCGARILARQLQKVQTELGLPAEAVFAWSDSAVVLGWLNKTPGSLNTFVANRVTDICSLVNPKHWRYVSTSCNPADLLSRGVSATELSSSQLWWEGPPWLKLEPECWPRRPDINGERELPELKKTVLRIQPAPEEFGKDCSSFDRLIRIRAWMERFCSRSRGRQKENRLPYISASEYRAAKNKLLVYTQKLFYTDEYRLLKDGRTLSNSHSISSLAPYLDKEGLIRVGGRLQKASLSLSSTHPIILNIKSRIVTLMIEQTHRALLHAGPSTVMATLAYTYHLPRLKRTLKKMSRACVTCQRAYARTSNQFMGELPASRLHPARPFSIIGLDFAGPFTIKRGKPRRPDHLKTYVCIFICFVTKAVHLEVVADLTSQAFLDALSKFVARRGCPSEISSDNGTNFVGAWAELRRITQVLRTEETRQQIDYWTSRKDITWKFSPARSPHFGGLWEAAVGAMKRILRKSVGEVILTYEELISVVTEAEAILNSRPLVPQDSPAEDAVAPLTPGHFLIGAPLTALPFQPDTRTKLTTLRRWNLVQRLQHHLWKRWREEFLLLLQKRNKWRKPNQTFKVGDIVLLKDADSFQRVWPLARVTETYPGSDGFVRVVDIWCKQKTWRRATNKLVHLLTEDEGVSVRGEDVWA